MNIDTQGPDHLILIEDRDLAQRLDAYLTRRFTQYSRSQFKKQIGDGLVLVNEQQVKPSYEVKWGDRISIWLPRIKPAEQLVPQCMPLDLLYEDEHILVVNKAAGTVVHPGAGHEENTLVHGLLAHCPKLAMQGAPQRPGIVHRLDKDTSGAMVVAKSERAYLQLIRQFKSREVRKQYLALVLGYFEQASGEIRASLGRHPTDRKKIAVVGGRGREAITRWQLKKQWSDLAALLLVTIETGRTHQIRVHLSYLNHPVLGDQVYGGGKKRLRTISPKESHDLLLGIGRQMLHAWRLSFQHPICGGRLDMEAPLPDDFKQVMAGLDRITSP